MANRTKEDVKNEKVIRGLLKLPANKRCINCNSLGPQYVCTNFWTFVCATCSGIHREFTHRVKSVSMAKFTPEEVSALQRGGNERAKEVYFKEWDPQRHFAPESSNVERLRSFIKHIYVNRSFTGEKSIDKHPKGDKGGTIEFKPADTFHGASRSPPFGGTNEHRHIEWPGPGGRNDGKNFRYYDYSCKSPRRNQGSQRYSAFKGSSHRIEIVDDRFRDDDRVKKVKKRWGSDDCRFSDGKLSQEGMSPRHQKDVHISSPPIVRPVRDILGENNLALRVGESLKADGDRSDDDFVHIKRTAYSDGLRSTDANTVELNKFTTGSLIDFDTDPEPPAASAPNDPFTGQSVQQPTANPSINSSNLMSFGLATLEKTPQSPPNASTLDSVLSQLSAPVSASIDNMSPFPTGGVDSAVKASDGGQCLTTHKHQPSLFIAADTCQSTVLQCIPQVGGTTTNQPWSSSLAPNAQGPLTAKPELPSQDVPSQVLPTEAKPIGRKELPADLFTATYSPAHVPVMHWQTAPSHGMAFGMQYPTAVAMPTFPQPSQSSNPFDLTSEPTQVNSPTFPSMASLQGALPNTAAHIALLRTSSFGTPSPQAMPHQLPSYPSAVPPRAYMMQIAPGNIPPLGHQGSGAFGSEGNASGTIRMDRQEMATGYPQPATPNSSLGGNPFG